MADTRIVGKKSSMSARSPGRVHLPKRKKKKVKAATKNTKANTKATQPSAPQPTTTTKAST